MCLAIPVRIIELRGDLATGEVGGIEREVSVMMTPGVKVGDYVIVHAGFALQIVDQEEAEENLRILTEMARATDKARAKARRIQKSAGRDEQSERTKRNAADGRDSRRKK